MSTRARFVLSLLLFTFGCFAQAPDCSFATSFSAAGNGQSVANISSSSGPACPLWMITVTAEGFSALQLHLQGAPDNAGAAGSFADFAAPLIACNAGTCAAPGANPLTSTTDSFLVARQYASWVRVVLDNTTGSGTVKVRANGYKANSSVAGASGGSGSGCTGTAGGVFFADAMGNCATDASFFAWNDTTHTLALPNILSQADLSLKPASGKNIYFIDPTSSKHAIFDTSALTADRTYTVQDATGTLAERLVSTASLNFPSINDGSCDELTLTLTGAATGDKIAPAWPTAVTGQVGLSGIMAVSAANTVLVRVCNLSGGAVDLGAATYGAAVLR